MRYQLTWLLMIFSLALIDCHDKGTQPFDNLQPGRRDYTWTVDTLKASPGDLIYLTTLWGSSATDLWAIGSGDASDIVKWHYDGKVWTRDPSQLSSDLQSMFGFAQNDVWLCDSPGGDIFHFDGNSWIKVGNYNLPGYPVTYLNSLWGDSPSNIYCVGAVANDRTSKAMILHFDGRQWNFVQIPDTRVAFTWLRRGILESNEYFMSATTFDVAGDTEKIYSFDGTTPREIYRTTTEVVTVNDVNGKVYFVIGKRVMLYQNGSFQLWKDFSGGTFGGRMWGRSEEDFFSEATNGIGHFNGTDFATLFQTDALIFAGQVFQNEVFFVGLDRNLVLPIVIHGVLKSK